MVSLGWTSGKLTLTLSSLAFSACLLRIFLVITALAPKLRVGLHVNTMA